MRTRLITTYEWHYTCLRVPRALIAIYVAVFPYSFQFLLLCYTNFRLALFNSFLSLHFFPFSFLNLKMFVLLSISSFYILITIVLKTENIFYTFHYLFNCTFVDLIFFFFISFIFHISWGCIWFLIKITLVSIVWGFHTLDIICSFEPHQSDYLWITAQFLDACKSCYFLFVPDKIGKNLLKICSVAQSQLRKNVTNLL